LLPKDFPPFTTVQGYFYDWRDSGLFVSAMPWRRSERLDGRGLFVADQCAAAQAQGVSSASRLLVRPVVDELGQHVGQIGLRIDGVQLAGLCRPPNYAERAGFLQDSSSLACDRRGIVSPVLPL
jgi:hypothetical protein